MKGNNFITTIWSSYVSGNRSRINKNHWFRDYVTKIYLLFLVKIKEGSAVLLLFISIIKQNKKLLMLFVLLICKPWSSKWGFEKGCVKDGKSKSNRDLLKIICLIIQILSSYQIPYNLNTWQFHPVIQVEIFVLNLDRKLNIPWLLSVLNISILYGINKHYIIIICDIETPNNKAFSLKYLLG